MLPHVLILPPKPSGNPIQLTFLISIFRILFFYQFLFHSSYEDFSSLS